MILLPRWCGQQKLNSLWLKEKEKKEKRGLKLGGEGREVYPGRAGHEDKYDQNILYETLKDINILKIDVLIDLAD